MAGHLGVDVGVDARHGGVFGEGVHEWEIMRVGPVGLVLGLRAVVLLRDAGPAGVVVGEETGFAVSENVSSRCQKCKGKNEME